MDPIKEALACLLGDRKILWRTETRHEAVLLMGSIYKKAPEQRETIVEYVLAGPETDNSKGDIDRTEALHFEFLSFLESLGVGLPDLGSKRLTEIRDRHAKWRPSKYPGMSHWTETGWVGKRVSGADILSLPPSEAIGRLRDSQDTWDSTRRDIAEAVGVALAGNWAWGSEALRFLGKELHKFSAEQVNPIWWGTRTAITENSKALSIDEIRELIRAVEELIGIRRDPAIWASVPSFLQQLVEKTGLEVEEWNKLAIDLSRLFLNYDYERETGSAEPVEWLDRAINHPYGDLTELYRDVATEHVRQLGESKLPLELTSESKAFFEFTLSNVGAGSRYGLCLIAERMSWLEVVDEKFVSSKLSPFFDWSRSSAQAEIAWSGFLWSRTLSKTLTECFDTTYLETAKHVTSLGQDERNGLASHVAAVFWFSPTQMQSLFLFATAVDSDVRLGLLQGWRIHLQQAEVSASSSFFNVLLLTYWDWCARQTFFAENDKERTAFLELVPFSGSAFPEAARRAIKYAPRGIEHPWQLLNNLSNSNVLTYRDEVAALLVKVLEVSGNPQWDDDEWKKLWLKLGHLPKDQQDKLRNALAEKGIEVSMYGAEG